MRARSLRSATGSAFITGRPKRARTAVTRSGGSLPCNCSKSGFSVLTMALSAASSASTVSATLPARPLTRSPSRRAAGSPRWRGLGAKNTKPTRSAPDSSATSSASGVFSQQILTISGMAGVLAAFAPSPQSGTAGCCLRNRPREDRQRARFWRACCLLGRDEAAADGVHLVVQRAHLAVEPAGAAPPFALADPGGDAADQHAEDQHREDDREQWRGRRIV